MSDYLPYGRQSIDDEEIRKVRDVLESDRSVLRDTE